MTDNQVFHDTPDGAAMKVLAEAAIAGDQSEPKIDHLAPLGSPGAADDRWVFTEENPRRELGAAGALANVTVASTNPAVYAARIESVTKLLVEPRASSSSPEEGH